MTVRRQYRRALCRCWRHFLNELRVLFDILFHSDQFITRVTFTVGTEVLTPTKEGSMDVEGYKLDGSQKVFVGTGFAKDDGSAATPDSVAHLNNLPDTIDVVPADAPADGFTIIAKAPGPFQVQVDFDADLGAGVVTQSALFSGQIVGGIITGLTFTPGVPEAK